MNGIYLDWNATAPLRPEARAALIACMEEVGNPSSVHGFGRAARRRVEDAREAVARLAGATSADVIFTGSGTEANNLALRVKGRARLIVSATEHAAVLDAASDAEVVPVGPKGLVDLEALERVLAADSGPALVSIQAVNNETGVIQPLAEVVRIAKAQGALVHSDAVQAVGRIPFDMGALGLDMATLSAHKIGGPQGVGALVARPGLMLDPLLRGGGQERRIRAGTENVAGIAAFGAAAAAALEGLDNYTRLAVLRDGLEERVREAAPDAVIFGADAPRVANTSCIALPGLTAETQLMAFDLAGIAVSSGAACSSGKVRASHVLTAMGAPVELAGSAIRVSLGWSSTSEEVDRFIQAWVRQYGRSRDRRA
ncbi:cysteine desulfurase family protein [Indioceanicola profundi]|uniref:cysteine desulfurase family protein n=1 Tax=Indioceanicola profundi TaxID=2220096 RepID=UPI000E6ABB91|nr:cysteine desulfurase family protein [Indioceanicola profundi]